VMSPPSSTKPLHPLSMTYPSKNYCSPIWASFNVFSRLVSGPTASPALRPATDTSTFMFFSKILKIAN
jgi:hypothetical protein